MNSRINQLMLVISALVGVTLLTLQNGSWWWHRYRVWAAHGTWCTVVHPDGRLENLYGSECRKL